MEKILTQLEALVSKKNNKKLMNSVERVRYFL